MGNRYYYFTTNAGNGVAVTAADDQQVAVIFHDSAENNLSDMIYAICADYSNVAGMTAEQMLAEYGNGTNVSVVTGFTPDLSDFESCTDITDITDRVKDTYHVIATANRFYQVLHADDGHNYYAYYDEDASRIITGRAYPRDRLHPKT